MFRITHLVIGAVIVGFLMKDQQDNSTIEVSKSYFKNETDFNNFEKIDTRLKRVFFDYVNYCQKRSLPCKITSLISSASEDSDLARVSTTHRDGRAFDVSVIGWSLTDIDQLIYFFTEQYEYKSYGAISYKDGVRRLAVYEDQNVGRVPHIHFQVSKI